MGYVPHSAARRLSRARPNNKSTNFDQVGLIYLASSDMHLDTVCLAMMSGAEHELFKLQASLTFVRVTQADDWEKIHRMTSAGGVDGWLLYGSVDDAIIDRLKPSRLPVVILGDHRCSQPVPCVNVDNFAVGRLAVQHLASLNHRRIAFLGSNLRYLYERETLAGFRATVRELGLDDDETLIGNLSLWTVDPAAQLIEWLRSSGAMPSAIFASEFEFASWIQAMLKEARIQVPTDISVLGYESADAAARFQNLTRIELPMREVGREGALLLHRVATSAQVGSKESKISASLIEGGSCCPPSGKRQPTQ